MSRSATKKEGRVARRIRRIWKHRALRAAIGVLGLWFALHTAAIIYDGVHEEGRKADVAVVFGSKVEADGMPSARLRARLERAVDLFNHNKVDAILVSGAVGDSGRDEAKVMASHLAGRGIPETVVFVDSRGFDTWRTADNAVAKARLRDWTSAIAVSQYFHISRAKLALRRHGFDGVSGAFARHFEARDLYSIAREFPAYYVYLLRPLHLTRWRHYLIALGALALLVLAVGTDAARRRWRPGQASQSFRRAWATTGLLLGNWMLMLLLVQTFFEPSRYGTWNDVVSVMTVIGLPALVTLLRREGWTGDLMHGFAGATVVGAACELWVHWKNFGFYGDFWDWLRPWQVNWARDCNGECGGWYTFETHYVFGRVWALALGAVVAALLIRLFWRTLTRLRATKPA